MDEDFFPIFKFSDEILIKFISFLCYGDIKNLSLVCKKFHSICKDPSALTDVHFGLINDDFYKKIALKSLRNSTKLTRLKVEHQKDVDIYILQLLKSHSKLLHLGSYTQSYLRIRQYRFYALYL